MAITPFDKDMDIIYKLSDSPNVDDGLTASQLKAKFDEGGKAVKDYINETLIPSVVEKPTFIGIVKSNGSGFVAATAGTDYQAPLGAGDITSAMLGSGIVSKAKLGSDVTAATLGGAVPSVAKMATLTVAGWSSNKQTVTVSGITASQHLVIAPAPASYVAYGESMVRCITQAANSLTFRCEDVPTAALTVNILIVG